MLVSIPIDLSSIAILYVFYIKSQIPSYNLYFIKKVYRRLYICAKATKATTEFSEILKGMK